MASTRLTNYIRDRIRQALIKRTFDPRKKELTETEHALGRAVYNDLYSAEVQMQMHRMPEGFLPTACGVQVKFGDSFVQVNWDSADAARRIAARRIADKHDIRGRAAAKVYEPDHQLTKEFQKLQQLHKQFDDEMYEARRQINSLLGSCTTVEKLIRTWPEVEEFAKPFLGKDAGVPSTALAIPIADLNKILGLPPQ